MNVEFKNGDKVPSNIWVEAIKFNKVKGIGRTFSTEGKNKASNISIVWEDGSSSVLNLLNLFNVCLKIRQIKYLLTVKNEKNEEA